ncbi:hypothetical protein [Deinococcus hopiensis]|uniref:hypothetical protein n=1 Tax=Deinococcus hopiensis TaxID=309885 RepID=UPI0009FC59D0|nr:hypothetical protein [Deinococcus hopiensis]
MTAPQINRNPYHAAGIQEMPGTTRGRVGKAYRQTPEGVAFARPVHLGFSHTGKERAGTVPTALGLGHQDGVEDRSGAGRS